MPQNTTSDQRKDATGNCIVHLSWSFPNNIATGDVSHFTVYINGTNIINETNNINESLTLAAYPVCSCATHNISISAVNRCGRVSPSTPNITLMDQRPYFPVECSDDTTMPAEPPNGATRNEPKCMSILHFYSQ